MANYKIRCYSFSSYSTAQAWAQDCRVAFDCNTSVEDCPSGGFQFIIDGLSDYSYAKAISDVMGKALYNEVTSANGYTLRSYSYSQQATAELWAENVSLACGVNTSVSLYPGTSSYQFTATYINDQYKAEAMGRVIKTALYNEIVVLTNGYTGSAYTNKVGTVVADVNSVGYKYPPNKFNGDFTGYYGQCTWYAWGRAYERCNVSLNVSGNAGEWYDKIVVGGTVKKRDKSLGPVAKSIAVFKKDGELGHVVFVEQVVTDTVYFTEGNSHVPDGTVQKKTKAEFATLWGKDIAGYITLS